MKRAILLFVLLLAISGSVIYGFDNLPFSYSNTIDSLITSSQNQTFLEIEYYPTETNKYLVHVNMYQVVIKKFSTSEESEALNPEQFFNRDYVPNDLIISFYVNENLEIDDKISSCKTDNSKCNVILDLSSLDESYFKFGCIEIYAGFEGNDDLKGSESSKVFLCKDKNTKVADAFDKTLSEELNKSENQAICIGFFIFIGFLVSALYATGGNPLKYFDITSPRLPGSKTKLKFNPNSKDNEVLMGRQTLRLIKKNLDNIQKELLIEIEKLARKSYEKKFSGDEYKSWSQDRKNIEVVALTKKFMKGINEQLAKLLSSSESTIISETNKLKGVESIKKEIEIKLETNNQVKSLLDSKLKEVSPTNDDYLKLSPKIEQYHKQSKAYVRSELTVDMRSMIVRGSASGKRIGKVRKVIESLPIISDISIGASAILNKSISPEFQILKYATEGVIGSYKKQKINTKIEKLNAEIENPDNFYNQKSSQNMTEIERAKLEAIKDSREKIKESLKSQKSDLLEAGRVELLRDIIKEQQKKTEDLLEGTKKTSEADATLGVRERFIEDLKSLKVDEKNAKSYNKLLEQLSSKNLKLKDFNIQFEKELDKYELPPGVSKDIFEENKKKILSSYKELAAAVAVSEKLLEDEKILSDYKTEGVALKPDTTINDVIALLSLRNLTSELNNIPCTYLKKQIEEKIKEDSNKQKEFDKEYGVFVSKFNPAERYEKLYEYAEKVGVEKTKLKDSYDLMDEIKQLKYSKSETTGYIEGYKDILNFTDKLVKEHDIIELGLMDTLQDQNSIISRYLETYGAFDSDLDGKRISTILEKKGFNAAVGAIVKKIGSEKDISKVFDIASSHATKMEERTEYNKELYALYINFYEDFEENLLKMDLPSAMEDKRLEQIKEFYADSMCEIYESGKYPDPTELSRVFNPNNSNQLTESEFNFKERAEKIYDVLKNSLQFNDEQKIVFINNLQKLVDTAHVDTLRITKDMDKGLYTELQEKHKGKSITNKWLHDSALRRAQAINVTVGLRENIFKLRDYVEDNVVTYNALVDNLSKLNNEKRDKALLLNYKLGNVVNETANLSGQEIFAETSIQMLHVLSESYDEYFRDAFEKPRTDYLKKELSDLIIEKAEFELNKGKNKDEVIQLTEEEKIKELDKLSPHLIYDIVEGRFDKVRKNLVIGEELSDARLNKIKTDLVNMTYSNMYNRVLYRGWESFEEEKLKELNKSISKDSATWTAYDLYNLLDGNLDKIPQIKGVNLDSKRKEILGSYKNTYDLMRSKGVEFLVGGVDSNNLEEVYYLDKAFNKFSAVKSYEKDKVSGKYKIIKNDEKLQSIIKPKLEKQGLNNDDKVVKNVSKFFSLVAHDGLMLQGMELTAEGERRFGWHIDIKSNYTPLHEEGTKNRAFKNISQHFSSYEEFDYSHFDSLTQNKKYKEYNTYLSKVWDKISNESNLSENHKKYFSNYNTNEFKTKENEITQLLDYNKKKIASLSNELMNKTISEQNKNEIELKLVELSVENKNLESILTFVNDDLNLLSGNLKSLPVLSKEKIKIDEIISYLPQKVISNLETIKLLNHEIIVRENKITGKIKEAEKKLITKEIHQIERELKKLEIENKYLNLSYEYLKKHIQVLDENITFLKDVSISNEKIKDYNEHYIRYEDAKDYVPSYKTVGITGKAINVKLSESLIEQEDGIKRRIIIPCDEDSKIRRFSYTLENEVNKCLVTFPMIGLMSESVSTFNTIFRSKDYVAEALENYKSFSTTDINDLMRNEQLAKQIFELYKEKWAFSNMSNKGIIDVSFDKSKLEKDIGGVITNTIDSMKKEISTYFVLDNTLSFDEGVNKKKNELETKIENSVSSEEKLLSQNEYDFLKKKYALYTTNYNQLKELQNISLPSIVTQINNSVMAGNSKEVKKSFDIIINKLTSYGDKSTVKTLLDNTLQKIVFDKSKLEKDIIGVIDNTLDSMEKEISTYFVLDSTLSFKEGVDKKQKELETKLENSTSPENTLLYQKELDFLKKKYDLYITNSKQLEELKDKSLSSILTQINTSIINRNSKEIESGFDKIIDKLTPYAGEYLVRDLLEDFVDKRKYYVDYELQQISNLKNEIKFYSSIEKKLGSEVKSRFKDIPKSLEGEYLLKHLETLETKLKEGADLDFVKDKIIQFKNLDDAYKILNDSIKTTESKILKISNTIKNKDDMIKVSENHSNKAKEISNSDIKFDKLFRNSSILFEHFVNTYETLYKTRNLSTHTRRVAYGLPGNEFGGTQFAGPIGSTPLQYFGTLGQSGNMGWFSVLATSFMFNKVDKLYKKRFALNYLFSDVPLITSPMGLSSRMQISKYYKIKFGVMKSNFGEFLEPNPSEKPAPTSTLLSSLFSKNIRGERRLTELVDFMGGSYAGTPKGARDVINYILYKPNAMKMDFKDKVYTLQDSRSMKKSSEFLYDVGIYAPFTNNSFIAGREITLFNDLYYNNTSISTFYPNRAMNLLSSAPQYGNPKYRNMAYAGNYKFSQSQIDLVEESIGYTDLGKTPMWNSLSIPLLPMLIGTSGLPLFLSFLGSAYMTGLKNTVSSGSVNLAIKGMKFFKPDDYYVQKYMLYSNKGIYSSMYQDYDS